MQAFGFAGLDPLPPDRWTGVIVELCVVFCAVFLCLFYYCIVFFCLFFCICENSKKVTSNYVCTLRVYISIFKLLHQVLTGAG